MALSACAKEVNFISVLLEEMTEIQKPSVIYDDNQGAIVLEKSRQVGMRAKHIDIRHHFLRDMVQDNDIGIKYIRNEENLTYIIMKNVYEAYLVKHVNMIKLGEL